MATTTIEELARLRRAKAEIKEEIEAKGVPVPSSALLDTYDDYVRQIQGQTEPAVWGGIAGDIDDQTDLKEILDGKYEKPATGIPAEDLEDGVIPDVSGFYVKPGTGIPASDLADGVIPDVSGFITKTVNDLANYYLKSETFTKSEVVALIGAISQFHYEIAASTSAVSSPASNVLYLIGPTGSGADKYEEYVYANNTWTKIGDTSIDLSDYVTASALSTALASYVLSSSITDVLRYSAMSLTDAQKAQARTNIGATAPEVFWATYGTATAAEIEAAYNAGKVIYSVYNNRICPLAQITNEYFRFVQADGAFSAYRLDINRSSNVWSVGTFGLELITRKVTSLSSSSTDNQYPSAKCVYDELQNKQGVIDSTHKLDYSLIDNQPTIPEFTDYTDAELQTAIDTAFANL